MKVALLYTDAEIKEAQPNQPPQHNQQQHYAWAVERGHIRPFQLIPADRMPFYHMRWLRWQLRTVMRYALPEQRAAHPNDNTWIPPTENSRHGDHWWFRSAVMVRASRQARRIMSDITAWKSDARTLSKHTLCLAEYRGFRLDGPSITIAAPTNHQYRGRVIATPAASLKEQANHHLRRMAAERDYYRRCTETVDLRRMSPWRVGTY